MELLKKIGYYYSEKNNAWFSKNHAIEFDNKGFDIIEIKEVNGKVQYPVIARINLILDDTQMAALLHVFDAIPENIKNAYAFRIARLEIALEDLRGNSTLASAIRHGMLTDKSATISMIKSQYTDNPELTMSIVGADLILEIFALC